MFQVYGFFVDGDNIAADDKVILLRNTDTGEIFTPDELMDYWPILKHPTVSILDRLNKPFDGRSLKHPVNYKDLNGKVWKEG